MGKKIAEELAKERPIFVEGCKAQGIDAVGIPADDVWYLRLNNFLRECVGICVYALRGDI